MNNDPCCVFQKPAPCWCSRCGIKGIFLCILKLAMRHQCVSSRFAGFLGKLSPTPCMCAWLHQPWWVVDHRNKGTNKVARLSDIYCSLLNNHSAQVSWLRGSVPGLLNGTRFWEANESMKGYISQARWLPVWSFPVGSLLDDIVLSPDLQHPHRLLIQSTLLARRQVSRQPVVQVCYALQLGKAMQGCEVHVPAFLQYIPV